MRLSFQAKIILTLTCSIIMAVLISVGIAGYKIYSEGIQDLVAKSKAIVNRSLSGAMYVSDMNIQKDLAESVIRNYPDGNVPQQEKDKVLRAVPIVAAMGIARRNAEKDNYEFRVAAIKARNQKNEANDEERAILDSFLKDPNLTEHIKIDRDNNLVTVSIPVRIIEKQQCLMCHGHPSTSPWNNGKDVLGYQMEDMKDGDLKGLFVVKSSLLPVKEKSIDAGIDIIIWGIAVIFCAIVMAYLIIAPQIKKILKLTDILNLSSHKLTENGIKLSESSETLAEATQKQSSAITETAASLEEISAMANKTTDNTNDSSRSAQETQNLAALGERQMQDMVNVIGEIKLSNQNLASGVKSGNKEISQIMSFIKEIESKTSVINEIVFQTKLLSFNASVEASRAGEHGKGFSVVAEEVGRLAVLSGKSAEEINGLLKESLKKVEAIISGNEERMGSILNLGDEKILKGSEVVAECHRSLLRITDSIKNVSSRVNEIAQASKEQSLGVSEIKKAIELLSDATETTSQISEGNQQQSSEIKNEAEDLLIVVQELSQILKPK